MAVPITLPSAGDAIEHGTPVPLSLSKVRQYAFLGPTGRSFS